LKLLPCSSPSCVGLGAQLPKSVAYPSGEPYLSVMYDGHYKCNRCGRMCTLGYEEFNALPDLRFDQLCALADSYQSIFLRHRLTADLVGAGLPLAHAEDMFRAGYRSSDEIHALSRS